MVTSDKKSNLTELASKEAGAEVTSSKNNSKSTDDITFADSVILPMNDNTLKESARIEGSNSSSNSDLSLLPSSLNFKMIMSGQGQKEKVAKSDDGGKLSEMLYMMIPCFSSSSYESLMGKIGRSSETSSQLRLRYKLYCSSVILNTFNSSRDKVMDLERVSLFVINSYSEHPLILSVSK